MTTNLLIAVAIAMAIAAAVAAPLAIKKRKSSVIPSTAEGQDTSKREKGEADTIPQDEPTDGVVTPEAGVGECASARKREHTHTGEMEEAEADTIPQDEPTDGMVTPEAGAGESASAKKRKYTHKEREIMREAINAETKKQLTDLGVGELTQKFVTTMNPTKQKIYVYLVRKGGAKRTQMTEELGMPLKTLETALQQMVKDGLISAPYSKRLDNYYALELDGQYVQREIRTQP